MRVGAVFPQLEIGSDPARIKDYAQAVEALGYAHLVAYDHVLGAHPERPGGWPPGRYTHRDAFHEPFVLFGFLAGLTARIEFTPGVIILPQRQTALVAKQAAELDVLSGGRLRLGVGIGWNAVEFEALAENFRNRGRRVEEQIAVLRALWTNEIVDYQGRWHRIARAGLNPLPAQRPIPVWMGGTADAALRRIARIADGWISLVRINDEGHALVERFRAYVGEAGRSTAQVGLELRISASSGDPDAWARAAERAAGMGATHLEFNTMGARYATVEEHIEALRIFREIAPVF